MLEAPSHRPRHRAPTAVERIGRRARSAVPVALVGPALATLVVGAGTGIAVAAVGPDDAREVSPTAAPAVVDTPVTGAGGEAGFARVHLHAEAAARRAATEEVSRSGQRSASEQGGKPGTDKAAAEKVRGSSGGEPRAAAKAPAEAVSDPRDIALSMLPEYGWDGTQFNCLDQLWIGESNWDHTATNPTSGAYGIPQSLPAEKMAAAGPDWRTNPATQIAWGLNYIHLSYGTPCAANSFKLANNWY